MFCRFSTVARACIDSRKIGFPKLDKIKTCLIPSTISMQKSPNYSTGTETGPEELTIPVPYGNLAAKVWGNKSGYPVFAFHGWLDNCGTFDRLIPLLSPNFYIVALDFPGHGLSSHRPQGCFYSYLDLILDLRRVVNFLSWHKFHIIGHSMGGEVAQMFASLYPNLVNKLVSLDIGMPISQPSHDLPISFARAVDGNLIIEEKLKKPPPIYSEETAPERLVKGMFGEITMESAKILLKRGTRKSDCGKGLIFTRDLRLRNIEYYNMLSNPAMKAFMAHIRNEMMIIMSDNSHPFYKTKKPELLEEIFATYAKCTRRFVLKHVEGNHFVHLNHPERIAPLINEFLADSENTEF